MRLTYLLIFVLVEAAPKSLPSFINKCRLSDPELNKCLEKNTVDAAQKLAQGNKNLGIGTLEPFVIKRVDLGATTSGAVSLHQTYENMRIFGMINATVYDSEANLSDGNCYWNYKCLVPSVRMESDYTMKGQLLIFPLNGHGNCTNYLYDVDGNYGLKCERYSKRNQTYLRVTEFKFSMKPKRVVLDFENIIDGNEQLSREVVKTLNENSESVYAEVGPAFNDVMGTVWKETINQVFNRVPVNELFLP